MARDWTSYRHTLLDAIGVSPALLGLALMGCDTPVDTLPADALAPPPMEIAFGGPLDTGVGLVFQVLYAPPGERVWLVAGDGAGAGLCPPALGGTCLDVLNAQLMGSAVADANGYAAIDIMLPHETDDGLEYHFQAASITGGVGVTSDVVMDITTHPPRVCGDHPWLTPNNAGPFTYLACAPIPASGVCPDGPSAAYSKQLRLFEYASGITQGTGFFPWDVNLFCNETSVEDACCYGMNVFQVVIGRPFTVEGEARTAETVERTGWCGDCEVVGELSPRLRQRLAEGWAETAAGEHASVASFARFALQLMQLGAPADLVADATRAMGDEVRHAKAAYGVASSFAGKDLGPGPLDTTGADESSVEAMVLSAVREGCIAETIAAAQARAAAEACTDEGIREMLEGVANDESRHATLAWRFVRWALSEHPELRDAVAAAFAEPLTLKVVEPDADAAVMRTYGHLDDAELQAVAKEVFVQVVRPCAMGLLEGLVTTEVAQA